MKANQIESAIKKIKEIFHVSAIHFILLSANIDDTIRAIVGTLLQYVCV